MTRRYVSHSAILVLLVLFQCRTSPAQHTRENAGMRFKVTYSQLKSTLPLDGRLLLMLSTDSAEEPRFQITHDASTQLVFGINVDGIKPGVSAVVDRSALGYPIKTLEDVPAGEYWVQARAAQVRNISFEKRAYGEVADGPRRGPTMESCRGQLTTALPKRSTLIRDATRKSRWFLTMRLPRFRRRRTPSMSNT